LHLYLTILKNNKGYSIDKQTAYWFFSAILQAFAAMLGIIGAFMAIRITDDRKSHLLMEFYPSLILISIVLIISIACLSLVPVLYPSFLLTMIIFTLVLAICGVVYLLISLHKLFKNF